MALQESGQISLADIQTEFGGSDPISMSEYYRGGSYVTDNNTGVPTSGLITLSDYYGSVRQFAFTISSNYSTPQNLATLATAAGWNGSDYLVATNDAIISSDTTGTAALTIDDSFPNGILLINTGYIVGMGGRGGNGGNGAQNGFAGGAALSVSSSTSINNSGTIAGGGGGGGAGTQWAWNGYSRSSPGSGGASGLTRADPGFIDGGVSWYAEAYPSQGPDAEGLYTPGGASYNWGTGGRASSPGGIGGSWGSAGDAGGTVDGNYNQSGYAGGAGGDAVSGNSYVTWVATGTLYGALV